MKLFQQFGKYDGLEISQLAAWEMFMFLVTYASQQIRLVGEQFPEVQQKMLNLGKLLLRLCLRGVFFQQSVIKSRTGILLGGWEKTATSNSQVPASARRLLANVVVFPTGVEHPADLPNTSLHPSIHIVFE